MRRSTAPRFLLQPCHADWPRRDRTFL